MIGAGIYLLHLQIYQVSKICQYFEAILSKFRDFCLAYNIAMSGYLSKLKTPCQSISYLFPLKYVSPVEQRHKVPAVIGRQFIYAEGKPYKDITYNYSFDVVSNGMYNRSK